MASPQDVAIASLESKRPGPDPAGVDPLAPLLAPVRTLRGVGSRLEPALARLTGRSDGAPARRLDLLWHLPVRVVDRRPGLTLEEAAPGSRVTLEVVVLQHLPGGRGAAGRGRHPYKVRCWTGSVFLHLVFFHAREPYLRGLLPEGERRVVSGIVSRFGQEWQIAHPELVEHPEVVAAGCGFEPVYPLVQGLGQRSLLRLIAQCLDALPALSEWQDPARLAREAWPGFAEALARLHQPQAPVDVEPASPARRRLAFDELLANQLALALVRRGRRAQAGRRTGGDGRLRRRLLRSLPFALTAAQRQASAEILADMAAPARMLRLLQGDVGSGKTLVALLAMLTAVESGAQAALMAPSELLARQHAATLARLLESVGIRPVVLSGSGRGTERRRLLEEVRSGRAPIVVGTHALFQEAVRFRDLALVVIDEQHRFGVEQRVELLAKGRDADVLVMTATPIPRTLVLSLYGDMAVSELRHKPPGRRPVETRVMPLGRLDAVVARLTRLLQRGARVFWVCPLVESSGDDGATAAADRCTALREQFGSERVGLVHGRMAGPEKDRAMAAFADGSARILVATTVIEVGVDVPEAGVIVIEHAERFGLAQLHQLRGRVGRGTGASTCILLYAEPLGEHARRRLAAIRESDDGFALAEADLALRGPGEVLGTRQSGVPAFRLVELGSHADLLRPARDDARVALERDRGLTSPRGHALRQLLRLFGRDAAIRLLRSG